MMQGHEGLLGGEMLQKVPGGRALSAAACAPPLADDAGARMSIASQAGRETLGLAFSIEDLVLARDWAERRGLSLTIQLDHAAYGVRFEEILSLTPSGQALRCAAIWRSGNGVVLQRTGERTRSHHTLDEALVHWSRLERRSLFSFRRWGRAR